MELIIRVEDLDACDVDRLLAPQPVDVIVDVDAGHSAGELAAAIDREIGANASSDERSGPMRFLGLRRTGSVLDAAATVGQAGIVSGDTVTTSTDQDRLRRQLSQGVAPVERDRAVVCVDVLAGPDAGLSSAFAAGRFSVGRERTCDVDLSDPTVSRRHLDVTIGSDGRASIDPLPHASNPVLVNGLVVTSATPVGPDDVVAIGGTRLAVRPMTERQSERIDHLGHVEYQRTPYRPPVVSERPAPSLGKVPVRRDGRRFQLMSALAPIAAGLTFYAFSKQPQFLIITLMSPLAMIGNVIEDRRHGRRTFRSESLAFAGRLVEWRTEIDAALEAERVERLQAAPDLARLAHRSEGRTVDLWARGRAAPDFLALRAGLGTVTPLLRPTPGADGDAELLEQAWAALEGTDALVDVPISAHLATSGVFGVHGPTELVDGVACSFVVQAACLHSPEDLVIAAAVSGERAVSTWLKWLPHVRSVASPLGGAHVVTDGAAARSLVGRLLEIAEERVDSAHDGVSGSAASKKDRRWPWMLVLLDSSLDSDHADIARLLDLCPAAGMSVVWLAASARDVPRQAVEVLVASRGPGNASLGTMWSTDPAVPDRHVEIEQLRADIGDRIARSLAPLRDASTASLASSIPRTAPLLDVLGVGAPTAAWVAENWLQPMPYGLSFPIGMGADGPLVLDLVEDGPHTLIGGTSGAGKSELMQSIVSSLAVHHSPQRLNFLFVDYKGGASSNVFGALPHTVGYVTNLSAELSLRALTSLRAELNRRMQVMEGKAKDLAEMLELYPDQAPPSLVIVVDEFATLVKEVPDFVDGIVDIAQRGRSLGIHLILATQRPSGCVNENILANTNLRISLRMLDRTDSMSVIGSPEASDIPVPLKGRAFARLGPRSLASFQSAFTGAALVSDEIVAPVLIAPYGTVDDSPRAMATHRTSPGAEPTRTHLDAVLDAIAAAAANLQTPAPRPPWREVLPEAIELQTVLDDERSEPARQHPGRVVAVGMLDMPERQNQTPALVDLERGGGLLIFGSGGSGKTTALRTLAASASIVAEPGLLDIFGFDFASRGLASIGPLPSVVDVAAGDDLEAVTRHLATLHGELERRRTLLSAAHAEDLTAYNQRHDPLSRVLVLVDGYGGFVSLFNGAGSAGSMSVAIPLDRWSDMLGDIVVEGRQVGIHVVVTADRRSAVPSRLHSSISNRLILRHADEQGYGDHGISMARSRGLDLSAGRGLWQADSIVQIAAVSGDASAEGQGRALVDVAASLPISVPSSLSSSALPDVLDLDVSAGLDIAGGRHRFLLGRHDRTGHEVAVDLQWSNFVVAGAGRTGRSTALNACIAGLAGGHVLWGIGPSSSGLDRSLLDHSVFGRGDGVGDLIERLQNLVAMGPTDRPHVLVVDDLDVFDDMSLTAVWEQVVKLDDVRVIASVETRSLAGYTTNPLLTALKRARRLLLLQPDDPTEVLQTAGVKSPIRPGMKLVAGRGVLIVDREPSLIQVGVACGPTSVADPADAPTRPQPAFAS